MWIRSNWLTPWFWFRWRICFWISVMPASALALGMEFCAESPRWLFKVKHIFRAWSYLRSWVEDVMAQWNVSVLLKTHSYKAGGILTSGGCKFWIRAYYWISSIGQRSQWSEAEHELERLWGSAHVKAAMADLVRNEQTQDNGTASWRALVDPRYVKGIILYM